MEPGPRRRVGSARQRARFHGRGPAGRLDARGPGAGQVLRGSRAPSRHARDRPDRPRDRRNGALGFQAIGTRPPG